MCTGELHPLTLYYQGLFGDATSFLIRRGSVLHKMFICPWGGFSGDWRSPGSNYVE
ncbi:MAG: hypothetical protein F6K17_16140 [Okeania sp. SIO3C4]|nr:hypothetical protein [Okeania sp. SIO3B3]NER04034.1 hypothetical protein [Okeania sp. SIO3C4]